ncbi:methyltransferase domain-containing protein [Leptolyngbya sp. BC1307]|uniref:class I SAM-dependent methyltransferase n=1 Tax=Leptolyngbya sp. BC1307 TaxID=2029589 RepID=UPI000EFCF2CF|nr:methyltransferase domain-containing protein [Leptolyngbya sp. BC1307]
MTTDAYDWFEPLYAQADEDVSQIPWALPGAVPYLTQWLSKNEIDGKEQTAVVVGCGLGDDAEALSSAGFAVTAFDVSESAIAWAKKRFPGSTVNYVTADLFKLPAVWLGGFDLVFDFRTIQALPVAVRAEAIAQIASLPKPGGTVLIITYVRADKAIPEGPPWPLTEQELSQFEESGLAVIGKETFREKESRFSDRIQIQYQAPEQGMYK